MDGLGIGIGVPRPEGLSFVARGAKEDYAALQPKTSPAVKVVRGESPGLRLTMPQTRAEEGIAAGLVPVAEIDA